ncbi:M48 family metallopeptidase [Parasegetibacter sp. NRK P23]|uniref:M48 family metallopeptidase n=1 Tax=Parasegetibacter sp. NRK P23 TaxID=2942999 RepID=UPI002043DBC3|nr:M48 family metallopeptidase [Parasegetibacter sp. NRK P23]MCM5526871.1 M48 family metallopeptidase [Parasegetibacter sp. NRK P23]
MKRIILPLVAISFLASCAKNPITGRNQLSLVPEAELQTMAQQEYTTFLSQNKVVAPSASKDAEMVRRVGQRIANAVTSYYTQQGLGEELSGYKWEYNLVNSNEANAWCMPGGKIVVYTGLLPITQNEAALAVVVGHEVAHALAKHGSERMSQGLLQQVGGAALSVAMASKPAVTQNLFMTAYGVGSNVFGTLPHSRKQELEADKLGLRFAAMAGYNPREAIGLWQRMAAGGSGGQPEFLSTHPDPERRIQELEKQMDEALKFYKPVK